jgi:plasmid maintenance system antidote protein VapI
MPITLLTARDTELLTALDRCPLTAAQLIKLSHTFAVPFRCDRLLRRRMTKLGESGLVRRATYTALAGRGGTPNYYLLTPLGHRMLHGPDAALPAKRFGRPLAPASHFHTHALAEVIVHLVVAAHRAGAEMIGFCRENAVALNDGQATIYPDSAFQLVRPNGEQFSYFVELDNSTERLATEKNTESWQRKIRVYESVRSSTPTRFRVLVFATRSTARVAHILALAKSLGTNPRRTLVCGITLAAFLRTEQAVTQPVFRDHLARETALLSPNPRSGMSAGLHERK